MKSLEQEKKILFSEQLKRESEFFKIMKERGCYGKEHAAEGIYLRVSVQGTS